MKQLLMRGTSLLRGFRRDDRGATALTFGLGLTVMMTAIGAAVDFALVNTKHKQAQDLADSVGLAAAVYVKNNTLGSSPESRDEGLMDGVVYKATDVGDPRFAVGGEDATVMVDYRDDEAVVTVAGKMPTTFMSLIGVAETDYEAVSVIKYEQTGILPSSVMLVLDNSGSMAWDDAPFAYDSATQTYGPPAWAAPRIDGLTDATRTLVEQIKTLDKGDVKVKDHVRMGMIPFSADIITTDRVFMNWGPLGRADIDKMRPRGATNSAPPMDAARVELSGEDAAHLVKGNQNPLKFVIFMTDGVNTVKNYNTWTPADGTGIWRGRSCAYWSSNACITRYYVGEPNQSPQESDFADRWWYGGTTWQEGKYRNDTDNSTLADCGRLKNSGVEVFAVGFATQEGEYDTNDGDTVEADAFDSARVHSFLRDCASGPEYYMVADNSTSLNAVFQKIGQTIHKRSIYVAR